MHMSKERRNQFTEQVVFVVRIDGKPYATFASRAIAEQAVRMWLGEIDGNGVPIPPHERKGPLWSALRGKDVDIVER